MGTAYRYLGMVKNATGDLKAARSFLQKSLDTFGDYIIGWDIARTLTYLGETARLSGDLNKARKIYTEALHGSRDAQSMPLMLDSLVGLAQLALQTGMPELALELSVFVIGQ
jgi:tetratricopeptide (TPR) repeat protein